MIEKRSDKLRKNEKNSLPYIKTKMNEKNNITKQIQFNSKQNKQTILYIYIQNDKKMLRHYFQRNFTLKNLNIFTKT